MSDVREVLGIAASIQVMGPDDVLIVQMPERYSDEEAHRIIDALRKYDVRCLVFGADMKLIVQPAEEPT